MPDQAQDAFAEGADAHLSGLAESDNPYDIDSDEFLSWNDGWLSIENEG